MSTCDALVQRILLDSLRVTPVDPMTTQIAPVLDPPVQLDMAPLFADEGALAATSQEILRGVHHLHTVMPLLGLKFSKLDVIPAAGQNHQVDIGAFHEAGCTVSVTGDFEVMKSPIGSKAHCETVVMKRVKKAAAAITAIADLPDSHCALYLLRYQSAKMNYVARTTPAADVEEGLRCFDVSVRAGYESIVGKHISDTAWSQVVLPTAMAGLGLLSAGAGADAAYRASRAATRDICMSIYPSSPGWSDVVSDSAPYSLPYLG